jgi:hypothetical protein
MDDHIQETPGSPVSKHPEFSCNWQEFKITFVTAIKLLQK